MEDTNNQFSPNNLPQDNLSPLPPLSSDPPKPQIVPEVSMSASTPEEPMPKMPDFSSVPQSTQIPQNNVPSQASISPQTSNIPPLPDVSAYNLEPEKRKSTSVLKVLIVIIVLLLVGVGAFGAVLYTRVYDPLWSPFRPKPEQVLQNMLQNMQNVKTVSSQTKLNLSTDDGKKINIDFGGVSDVTDKLNPKSSGKISIVSNFGSGDSFKTSTMVLGEKPAVPGSDDSLKAEVTVVDKDLYFKISELNIPSFGLFFLMFGVDTQKIIGNWIKVPKDFQKTITEKDSVTVKNLTEEQMAQLTEKIQKIIAENNIFIVKEELADKVVDKEKMYNYVLVINNENLLKVFGEIMQESVNMQTSLVENKDENKGANTITSYVIGAMKGVIREALDKIGEIKINVLIGKKDNLLYGFDVLKTINIADLSQGEMAGKINVSLQGAESNFNEPVSIIAPSSFKTIEEIFPIDEFLDSNAKINTTPNFPKIK